MPTKIDFTGTSLEPLVAAVYAAIFTGYKIDEAKSSGQMKCQLEFTLEDEEVSGRKVWATHSLQSQSLFALKRSMVAIGADPVELSGPVDLDEVLTDLVGSSCRLDISLGEYEGRPNNKVDRVLEVE